MLRSSVRRMVFRFDRAIPEFPLCVRSVGHYRLEADYPSEVSRHKWFVELFWTVGGGGEFGLGGRSYSVGPGDVFFYLPGEVHDVRSIGKPWDYRWVTLDHAESARWFTAFGFKSRPFAGGPCPEEEFRKLEAALKKRSAEGDREASLVAHSILLTASQKTSIQEPAGSLADRSREIIDRNFTNPHFTVELVASQLQVHRSTLFRAFVKSHRLTPSRYLQNLRIHKALNLLPNPKLQIQEIAWQSGFEDPNYFSRAIREVTGSTPRELRRG